jgi:ATP-dependent 26S proteasome regulatory subunit
MKDIEEYDWIAEIGIRRRSLFSNIILVETEDNQRTAEFLLEKKAIAKHDPECLDEEYFVLDGWKGLLKVDPNPENRVDYVLTPVPDMKAGTYGIDNILESLEEILEEGNKVVVFQNIYEAERAINSALLSWSSNDMMREEDSTIIIFASSRNIFPEKVWQRMSIIKPPRSTPDERNQMLIDIQHDMIIPEKDDEDQVKFADELGAIIALTAGMTKDQLEAAAVESVIRYNRLDNECIAKSKSRILANNPALEVNEQTKFGFEGVGGYEKVKEIIRNYVVLPLEHPDAAERFNVSRPRGIIFFGPPGSGKTLFVNSMAKEMNMSVLKIQMEHVLGKYVGESEKSLRNIFDIADAMSPCILFIDEIDKFSMRDMGAGTNQGSHVERELFSMLLEKLGDENRKWFFAGATNIISALDPALIRTGRVDSVIPIPFPDKKARKQIFNIHAKLKRKPPLADDIDIEKIAEATYLWSGSDIEQLVVRTTNYVMKEAILHDDKDREITMDDIEYILSSFNINTKENSKVQEKIKKQAIQYTNDRRLIEVFDSAQKIRRVSRTKKGAEIVKEKANRRAANDSVSTPTDSIKK